MSKNVTVLTIDCETPPLISLAEACDHIVSESEPSNTGSIRGHYGKRIGCSKESKRTQESRGFKGSGLARD